MDPGVATALRGVKRLVLLSAAAMVGCSAQPKIDTRYHAVSQDSRVQFIVLHYTEIDFARSLHRLTEEEVSSHYLVNDQPPTIYRLVDEDRRAWHAGPSYWQGYTHLNSSSIGIEIVNSGNGAIRMQATLNTLGSRSNKSLSSCATSSDAMACGLTGSWDTAMFSL
jgi:hypothetical protein